MVHYSSCPVCGSNEIEIFLQAKDYTVSGKFFPVIQCKKCTAAFTNNIPAPNEIGAYYKSENYISHSDTAQGLVNKLTIKCETLRWFPKKIW